MIRWKTAIAAFFSLSIAGPAAALADDVPTFALSIQDHKFAPASLRIPKDTKVKLVVANRDPTPEEFESYEFNREKIIPGGSEGTVYIGPLDAGTYRFFGDFHQDTAQGTIVAQ